MDDVRDQLITVGLKHAWTDLRAALDPLLPSDDAPPATAPRPSPAMVAALRGQLALTLERALTLDADDRAVVGINPTSAAVHSRIRDFLVAKGQLAHLMSQAGAELVATRPQPDMPQLAPAFGTLHVNYISSVGVLVDGSPNGNTNEDNPTETGSRVVTLAIAAGSFSPPRQRVTIWPNSIAYTNFK